MHSIDKKRSERKLVRLLAKYARRKHLTGRERVWLDGWFAEDKNHRVVADLFRDGEDVRNELERDPEWADKVCREILG